MIAKFAKFRVHLDVTGLYRGKARNPMANGRCSNSKDIV